MKLPSTPLSSPLLTPFFLAHRNMRLRIGRTLLTVLGIILGVAVVLAIQITNQTTLDSLRRVFDRTAGQANLLVVPLGQEGKVIDEEMLAKVEKTDGVEVAAPSIRARTLLASEARSWQITFSMTGVAEGSFFVIYGVDPELDPSVRVYKLAAGRMPKPEKYEVVLPEGTAADKDLNIGEELVILVPNGTARLKIVGLLAEEGVALLNDGDIAFTSLEVLQNLFGRRGELDEIALRINQVISEDPKALEVMKAKLSARVEKEGEVIYPASRGELVSQMLATYQLGLTFFSIIAIFVGTFLIYNAFSMTVVERTREIGMLRAIGMNRHHVLGMVLAEAGLLSIVGSILGLGLGVFLARGLITLLGNLVTAEESLIRIPLNGIIQSVAVGLGVTLIASLIPALQAARITPLEAMRQRSRSGERPRPILWQSGLALLLVGWLATYHIHWPDRVIFFAGNFAVTCFFLGATLTVTLVVHWLDRPTRWLAAILYGNEGSIGSSNVRRSIGRTTLTVASLMVALTMIISISSLAFSFKSDMSKWITNALGGDLYVRAPVPMRESFANQLKSVPGVKAVTPARILTIKAARSQLPADKDVSDTFYYNAIDPSTFLQIGDMEFAANQGDPLTNWRRLSQGSAVFISNVVADRFNLRQGDEILLLTNRGERPFYIAAEVMDFGGEGQVLYGTYEDLRRWFSEQGVDRFTISVEPGYPVEAVSQAIQNRYQGRQYISVQTTESFKKGILDLMDQSFRLFDVLNVIGVIIGSLGVINTLIMNVLERQREIGGLRSLGMTRRQVLRMVLAEALTLGIMGGIYGLAIGYVIAQVLIMGTNMMIGYDLVFQFTPSPFLIGILIALGVVQIAAIYPARRASSVNIVEAIKHE